MHYPQHRGKSGQVMVMAILVMSATFIAATAIAGLLIVLQIQQSGDFVRSSQAIAAADAGIEYRLCMFFRDNDTNICGAALPVFTNGASVDQTTITCFDGVSAIPLPSCDDPAVRKIRINSTGLTGTAPREVRRMLQLDTDAS